MPLHQYQKEAANFLYQRTHAALFADPGAGKTLTILAVLHRLWAESGPLRILIIAPMRVCRRVWPEEIKKFGFTFSTHFLHGKQKTKTHSDADIELINPEGLKWLIKNRTPEYDILIIDESNQFKNGRSVRFRLLKQWLPHIPRIYILTGTPTPRSMLDLWSQVYFLDRGETLGKYLTHYRQRFFCENRYLNFSEWTIKKGADEQIWELITPLVHRVDADLKLPELIENPINIELPKKVQKIYNDMWKKLAAEIENELYLTESAATKYQTCCQIASGAMYRDDKTVLDLHFAKLEALKNLISELQGKPILIGFRYKHEADRLHAAFGQCIISGRTSVKHTDKLLNAWNTGQLPILCAQIQTISHGLNLQASGCNDVCWYTLTDDYDRFEQFNRRIYRQGLAGAHCRIHYLIAHNTVDGIILRRLKDRHLRQQSLFNFLRDYALTKKR